jgi:hypothetical protein
MPFNRGTGSVTNLFYKFYDDRNFKLCDIPGRTVGTNLSFVPLTALHPLNGRREVCFHFYTYGRPNLGQMILTSILARNSGFDQFLDKNPVEPEL